MPNTQCNERVYFKLRLRYFATLLSFLSFSVFDLQLYSGVIQTGDGVCYTLWSWVFLVFLQFPVEICQGCLFPNLERKFFVMNLVKITCKNNIFGNVTMNITFNFKCYLSYNNKHGYKLATRWSCWVENQIKTISVKENHLECLPWINKNPILLMPAMGFEPTSSQSLTWRERTVTAQTRLKGPCT